MQSLFDSFGDVFGNLAVILLRDELGVLIQAIGMICASLGVVKEAGNELLPLLMASSVADRSLTAAASDADGLSSDSDQFTSVLLLAAPIFTKGIIFRRCCALTDRPGAEECIVLKAIQDDAYNDIVMSLGALMCAFPERGIQFVFAPTGYVPRNVCHRWRLFRPGFRCLSSEPPEGLRRMLATAMDPAWAFLASLPIIYGWCTTAKEQAEALMAESPPVTAGAARCE
eukprot:TRINITY_DN49404_c0_g1_i2.p1 TRINITY_DN49404_c0_g1~~TRINITY_DN49404_c0_g1_i2.p1  ORF type:complete len:228 (+),score=26.69 TRINITY_DN49404_c0_g1_i2:132-815(+)